VQTGQAPHISQTHNFYAENSVRRRAHLPYSPVFAPSDFFPFGHVKHHLQGTIFGSREELLEPIGEIDRDAIKDFARRL
jgi:hypothetical protein